MREAVQHVQDAVERFRKTPCRANRQNRARGALAPSTKARWQWKLRIVEQLAKIFPITDVVVENISARTIKGARKWNRSFSPLEAGKAWFYDRAMRFGRLHLKEGWETKAMRDLVGLKKTKAKLAEKFTAHCVDSWVLANNIVGGHVLPENTSMLYVAPIRLHRRQLHAMQFAPGGSRRLYGGTRSCGLKRGSLVSHPKWGLAYVGGTTGTRVSLHSLSVGKRLCQNVKPDDLVFKSYNTWKRHFLPALKDVVSVTEIR